MPLCTTTLVYAMDGLFGLPRKMSAGVSYKDPLLGSLFFGGQSSVNQFAAESNKCAILYQCVHLCNLHTGASVSKPTLMTMYVHMYARTHVHPRTSICTKHEDAPVH